MSNCSEKPYETTHISEIDIDDLATAPDYFLGVRALTDGETGNTVYTPVRIPGARVMPTGNLANVVAIDANNTAITVPEKQVRAGYIDVQPGGNIMKYADENNPAVFIIVAPYTNGKYLIQTTGFLRIDGGHQYLIGQQYYLGENGEPTTDSTITGQKLFKPIDDYVLDINGEF